MARQETDLKAFEREFKNTLEEQRAAELSALAELGEAQALFQVFLQQESRRVEGELGPDHPRSRSLKTAAAFNLDQIDAFSRELDIGRIRVPPVAQDDALVHGRVRETGGALPGLTVCLVDMANDGLAGIDPATTDRSGYYSIAVPLSAGRYQSQASRRGIFLAVFTPAGKLLHRGKQPLELAKGVRLQIEVTLDRDAVFEPSERVTGEVKKERAKPPADAVVDARDRSPDPLAPILATLGEERGFADIGASARKLQNRLGALGLETKKAVGGLLDRADREVRDGLKLPNLKSAQAFKRILAKVLKKTA